MRKEKTTQTITISLLAIAILVMSIGFASYAQNLNINGTATFASAKWDVHFDTSSIDEKSTIVSNPAATVSTTDVTYTVSLPEPGDEYTFDIDVVNAGTFDAELKKITITPAVASLPEYVEHVVTYDGVDYTATTDNIGKILPKKTGNTLGRETVTVKVKYKDGTVTLPDDEESITFAVTLSYVQAD